MEQKIESFMELYNHPVPSLLLFDNLLGIDYAKEKKMISKVLRISEEKKLNPMNIVLESMINIAGERISSQTLTHSKDKVLINHDIRNRAVKNILQLIDNDPRELERFHESWLEKLTTFLRELHQNKKNLKMDEVIFLVSNKFRISAISTIEAIGSITV